MNNTFEIKRIQNYCKDNGVKKDNDVYLKHFLFDDDGNIYKWEFEFPKPNILDLRISYPDDIIERQLALVQIRAFRNKFLRQTDSLVSDRVDNVDDMTEIRRFRKLLRDLPANLNQQDLRLNSSNKINVKRYFNKKNFAIANNLRPYIKTILDETEI